MVPINGHTFNSLTLKTLLLVQPDTFMYSFNVCEGESRAWMEGFHNFSFFSVSAPYAPLHTGTFEPNFFQIKRNLLETEQIVDGDFSQFFSDFLLCSLVIWQDFWSRTNWFFLQTMNKSSIFYIAPRTWRFKGLFYQNSILMCAQCWIYYIRLARCNDCNGPHTVLWV